MAGISPFERFVEEGRNLPRLPVPTLESTLTSYVGSVSALATAQEFRTTALNTLRFLQNGSSTSGPALHKALLQRAAEKGVDRSYLIDWWCQLMYTAWREPLPVNVSYWYMLGNAMFATLDAAADKRGLKRPQTFRAAALVLAAAAFRDRVWTRDELLEGAPGAKSPPLDGSMFRYVFHACRLPREGDDGVRVYDGTGATAPSDAIVVISRGRFYAVSLAGSDGGRTSWEELVRRLDAVVSHADSAARSEGSHPSSAGVGLGALTAGHRETWAAAAAALTAGAAPGRPSHGVNVRSDPASEPPYPLSASAAHNLRVLTTIESALLVLCLDEAVGHSVEARSMNLLVGSAHNRWFDKAAQLVLDEAGGAGFIGEHSHSDGMPTAVMIDWVAKNVLETACGSMKLPLRWQGGADLVHALQATVPPHSRLLPGDRCGVAGGTTETVLELEWVVPLPALAWLSVARAEVAALAASHRLLVVRSTYGRTVVSKRYKVSPDAWAQMAMQLAYWRWRGPSGAPAASYEPAHTRRFLWGRTACIRVASAASAEWTSAMTSVPSILGAAEAQKLGALLRRACAAHVTATQAASAGLDVDRHLLGLRRLYLEAQEATAKAAGGTSPNEDPAAAFFSDPLFTRSKTWLLSTSNLTIDCVENWGWGEVTPGGLGVAYSTREDCFVFNIVGEAATGIEGFSASLEAALRDMAAVAEAEIVGTAQPRL